jgi:hypothetical protein
MRILEEQPCCLLTVFDRVIVTAWSPIPSDEDAVAKLLNALLLEAQRQGKVALLVALLYDSPLPSEAVRRQVEAGLRKVDPFVICGATVIDKAGFRASALRAVVAAMQRISLPKHPERVFAQPEQGVEFIRMQLSDAGFAQPAAADLLHHYRAAVERASQLGRV